MVQTVGLIMNRIQLVKTGEAESPQISQFTANTIKWGETHVKYEPKAFLFVLEEQWMNEFQTETGRQTKEETQDGA